MSEENKVQRWGATRTIFGPVVHEQAVFGLPFLLFMKCRYEINPNGSGVGVGQGDGAKNPHSVGVRIASDLFSELRQYFFKLLFFFAHCLFGFPCDYGGAFFYEFRL